MNTSKLMLGIVALISLSVMHSFATISITNSATMPAEVYVTGIGYKSINPKSLDGNLLIDPLGKPDALGQTRILQPGQNVQLSWDDMPRAALPIENIMVKFLPNETLFSKAIKDNKAPQAMDVTVTLTEKDGKAHVRFE